MTMNELTALRPMPPAVIVPACVEDCLNDDERTVELTAILEGMAAGLRIVADADAVWSLVRGKFWLGQAELVDELRRGAAELFEALGPVPAVASVRVHAPAGDPQHALTVHMNRRAAVPFVSIVGA